MFPRDTSIKGEKGFFRKQHVFEALCRILLLGKYDYDKKTHPFFGEERVFYESLEGYKSIEPARNTPLKDKDILDEPINVGSSAGSVDIFFKIPSGKQIKTCENACECTKLEIKDDKRKVSNKKDVFILIQNKFLSRESGTAKTYDINKIFTRAGKVGRIGKWTSSAYG